MMKSLQTVVILVTLLASTSIFLTSVFEATAEHKVQLFPNFSDSCGYRERDFLVLAKAIANGLNFFNQNVHNLVMDAGIGTRIIERQIGVILKSKSLSNEVFHILRNLMSTASTISNKLAEKQKMDDTLDDLEKKASLPWITSELLWATPNLGYWKKLYVDPELKLDLRKEYAAKEVFDEPASDACIGQLFNGCTVSEECKTLFLTKVRSMYSVTHQVIYYHIADQLCIDNEAFPFGRNSKFWKTFSVDLCSRVFLESKAIEQEGFPAGFRDIFAEQMIVCSMTGFEDFLANTSWLYEMLFWQNELTDDMACFPDLSQDNRGSHSKKRRRTKRSDNTIDYAKHKCSVHFSSVGTAALTLHLRHLLETCI